MFVFICKYFFISYLKSSDSFSVTLEMGNARSCMGVRIQESGSVLDLPLIKHITLTFTLL